MTSIYVSSALIKQSYICFFMCATSKAVHLKLVANLEGGKFIQPFSVDVSQGSCLMITLHTLKIILLNIFSSGEGIKHPIIFFTPPWWGRFYKMVVHSIKTPLKKVIFREA